MLAAAQNTEITVTAEGDDSAEAIEEIGELINDYFGEGE